MAIQSRPVVGDGLNRHVQASLKDASITSFKKAGALFVQWCQQVGECPCYAEEWDECVVKPSAHPQTE